jgi:DNA polymerase-3 subunit delta'
VLKDIQGQTRASRILSGTIRKNRLPTTILISGEIGTGKRFAAINYAKAINCLSPADNDSCDKCISCNKIDSGIHPDVFFVEPDNDEIKIAAIRKLEDKLYLKSFEGKKKIAVVDDAHRMNNNAANAFLKTLEEPPDNSIIILLSSNEDALPDTIKSRCVKINFFPLPARDCQRIISEHVRPEDLTLSINLSMGRPGIAGRRNFSDEKAWFLRLYNNMLTDNSKDTWADKEQIRAWLDMALVFLRDVIVYDITDNASDALLGNRNKSASIEKTLNAYDILFQIRSLLDSNLNKSITWNYTASIIKSLSLTQPSKS